MLSYACFETCLLTSQQCTATYVQHSSPLRSLLRSSNFILSSVLTSRPALVSHALPVRISLGRRFRSRLSSSVFLFFVVVLFFVFFLFFFFFFLAADVAASSIRPTRQRRQSGRRPSRRQSFAADAHFGAAISLERRALRCVRPRASTSFAYAPRRVARQHDHLRCSPSLTRRFARRASSRQPLRFCAPNQRQKPAAASPPVLDECSVALGI
jgi:hypothetical protein